MNIGRIIKSEAAFLRASQTENGSFESFTSSDRRRIDSGERHRSFFVSPLMLSALSGLSNNDLRIVKNGLFSFLIGQRSRGWSFNYWERGSKDSETHPYPDDLDDTFCALSALCVHDPKAMNGGDLARIVSLLTAVEDAEGGPYRTWLVPESADKAWKDVDLAVNSNVAYFLSLQETNLESIDCLIEKAAKDGNFSSPYYASPFSVIYFISRSYRGPAVSRIVEYLVSEQSASGGWGNVLDTALAISSLANFEAETGSSERGAAYLLREKRAWRKAYPFVIELIKGKKTHYSGSPFLTVAFVLEALQKQSELVGKRKAAKIRDDRDDRHHAKVMNLAVKAMGLTDGAMKERFDSGLSKIGESHYAKQITLLSRKFVSGMKDDKRRKIRPGMTERLGTANVLGWMAYSIYDDFYDGEGRLGDLPLANVCLSRLGSMFLSEMRGYPGFVSLFDRVISGIDQANGWEMDNCRLVRERDAFVIPERFPDFGKYDKLAERSMGHALGPVAVLIYAGCLPGSSEVRNLMSFFSHYIIAKQFNDDAHDYEDDILAGRLTPVTVSVINRWIEKQGKKRRRIGPERDIELMRKIFWNETIVWASEEILVQARSARQCSRKLVSVGNQAFFEELLEKEEQSARKALEERTKALEFIRTFGK